VKYSADALAECPFSAGEDFSMAGVTRFRRPGLADVAMGEAATDHAHLADSRQRVAARPSATAVHRD